jgi:hypothetical protein
MVLAPNLEVSQVVEEEPKLSDPSPPPAAAPEVPRPIFRRRHSLSEGAHHKVWLDVQNMNPLRSPLSLMQEEQKSMIEDLQGSKYVMKEGNA